ncbi:MAG: A24 family peptidase [Rhodothermaceae bacterium]
MIELFIIAFTLVTGSFTNSVISGFLNNSGLDLYRSKCFCGKRNLKLLENIPVLSFIFLKGTCKECNGKIAFRYLATELFSLAAGLIIYQIYGLQIISLIYYLLLMIFYSVAIIDFKKMVIPNSLVFAIFLLYLVSLSINQFNPYNLIVPFSICFSLLGVNQYYERKKNKTAIGMGDVKYIFAAGLFLSPFLLIVSIWISALLALLFSLGKSKKYDKENKIAFGTFLSAGFTLALIFSNNINEILIQIAQYE